MPNDIQLDEPLTRIETFLAAAAGENVELPEPETRIEKYLAVIAGKAGVPAVEASDKGKFLHTNESTGALEWAEGGGSGGGVLVVTDTDGTLDKTWQEIHDAIANGIVYLYDSANGFNSGIIFRASEEDNKGTMYYNIRAVGGVYATATVIDYTAPSADDYPELQE